MLLSRAWLAALALALASVLGAAYLAIGECDRQVAADLHEQLASDSSAVEARLELDARNKLDALLVATTDPGLQQALGGSNASKEGRPPLRSRLAARKALAAISDAIPPASRTDALFAVDRDGHVLASLGYDAVASNEDFELGGYPAVNDALHGWARDDVWTLGNKMYWVVARPTLSETGDVSGAVVGLTEVTAKLASDLAARIGTNVVFYASGEGMAGGVGVDGFDRERLKAVGRDLKDVSEASYGSDGRSSVKTVGDGLAVMYVRLPGDVWPLGGGFAVVRSGAPLGGLFAALGRATPADRANVPWVWLVVLGLFAAGAGVGLTVFEQTMPLRDLLRQVQRVTSTEGAVIELGRLFGDYRVLGEKINEAVRHASTKAAEAAVASSRAVVRSQRQQLPKLAAGAGTAGPPRAVRSRTSSRVDEDEAGDLPTGLMPQRAEAARGGPSSGVTPLSASGEAEPPPSFAAVAQLIGPTLPSRVWDKAQDGEAPKAAPVVGQPLTVPPPSATPTERPKGRPPGPRILQAPDTTAIRTAPAEILSLAAGDARLPDTTAVVTAPAELLAESTQAEALPAEWRDTFDEFIRVRKECGEPTETLTFEKFSATLQKHRDALVKSTKCKKVSFAVAVKDGKASLKATPIV